MRLLLVGEKFLPYVSEQFVEENRELITGYSYNDESFKNCFFSKVRNPSVVSLSLALKMGFSIHKKPIESIIKQGNFTEEELRSCFEKADNLKNFLVKQEASELLDELINQRRSFLQRDLLPKEPGIKTSRKVKRTPLVH